LYNLKKDIGEENDLSKTMPEKAKELMSQLKSWKAEYLVPGKMDKLKKKKKK